MTNEQFYREKRYQSAIAVVHMMERKGLVTEDEVCVIDTILLKKYRPLLGGLYAAKPPKTLDNKPFLSDI